MKKSKNILYILGITYSSIILSLSVLFLVDKNDKSIAWMMNIYMKIISTSIDGSSNSILGISISVATIVLLSLAISIKLKRKVFPIIIIILSSFHLNIFSIVAAVFHIIEISSDNRKIAAQAKLNETKTS